MVLHGFEQWRRDFELLATALHESAGGVPELVRVARTALCAWFWLAPGGPILEGRIDPRTATPKLLAKHVSRDLEAAKDWWLALTDAERAELLGTGPEPREATA